MEQQPFDIAWRTIDGLKIRYASNGTGNEKVVLVSPWPQSIFAFAPVWAGLSTQFEVLAIDLPGFGQSEARDDLFAPHTMGEFIAKALDGVARSFGYARTSAADRVSFLAPYGNAQASAVAKQLDEKILAMLTASAE